MSRKPEAAAAGSAASVALTAERGHAVAAVLAEVRRIVGHEKDPASVQLEEVGLLLAGLARRDELFPDAHFPAPVAGEDETLYLLGQSDDLTQALYVWRPASGFATAVHDHSTWAVVAGIEGVEPNMLWRRLDDACVASRCALEPVRRVRIGPGDHIHFGPHDIHSVAIDGKKAIKHLHLYGRSLIDLPERVDFNPLEGTWQVQPGKPLVLAPLCGDPASAA